MQPSQKEPPNLSSQILQLRADAAGLESRIAAHCDGLAQPDDLRAVADALTGMR